MESAKTRVISFLIGRITAPSKDRQIRTLPGRHSVDIAQQGLPPEAIEKLETMLKLM